MSGSVDLTCKELVEDITGYVEGTMPDDDRRRFDEHLDLCRGCRNYIDQMEATIKAVGSLREEMLSPEARESLLATFRGWRGA